MAATQSTRAVTQDDTDDDDPNYVVVELGPKFQNRIFHEFDDGHPGGEALVVNGRRVRVRYTGRVREALGSGLLVMSRKEATPRPPDMSELLEENRRDTAGAEAAALAQAAADLASAAAGTAAAANARPVPEDGVTSTHEEDEEGGDADGDGGDGDPPKRSRAKKAPTAE